MKRSFYEMLGVPRDAEKSQIDTAYTLMMEKLESSTNLRGASEAVTEMNLIREGYQILSDPARRARYDGKLAADASGVKLMFFPEDTATRRKLGVETVILAALATVLGGIVYWQLTHKIDDVRIEHAQAVVKEREKKDQPITVDLTKANAPNAKAGAPEPKR